MRRRQSRALLSLRAFQSWEHLYRLPSGDEEVWVGGPLACVCAPAPGLVRVYPRTRSEAPPPTSVPW
eukprot:2273678-Alexandrium_andersonii.AAC.1